MDHPVQPAAALVSVIGNAAAGRLLRSVARRGAPGVGAGLDASVAREIQARRGRGSPLPGGLRSEMEDAFTEDFSQVRIHADSAAQRLVERVEARAFTIGNDVFLAQGPRNLTSVSGRRLLAHELTHVVQQSGADGRTPDSVSDPAHAAERQAATVARRVEARRPRRGRDELGGLRGQSGRRASVTGVLQRNEEGAAGGGAQAGDQEFVVQLPEPGPAREDTPSAPRPGLERAWFQDVALAADAEFLRGELRRLIARRGLDGADRWYSSFKGSPPPTVGLPFSAHTRPYMRRPVRSPLDVQTEMRQERQLQAVRAEVTPLVDRVWAEVRRDAVAFLAEFESRGRQVVEALLDESEARVEAERLRYGLTREVDVEARPRPHPMGGFGGMPQATVRHGMEETVSSRGLAGAAADLKAKREEINVLARQRGRLLDRRMAGPAGAITTLPERNRPEYERLGREIEDRRREHDILRHTYEERYPILASFADDARAISRIAGGPSPEVAALLNEQTAETLGNIHEVRSELGPDGGVKIWKLPEIVAITKSATGAEGRTSLGSMRERLVDDKIERVRMDERFRNIALGALALGLGLLAAIPTGGKSLAVAAGLVARLGSLGVQSYLAGRHIQEYQLGEAMAGSDFDRAQAISAEDPSLFWLAVDIVGVALDIGPAARASRQALVAGRDKFRQLAGPARQAVRAPGDAAEEIARLETLAERAGGPALAARVAGSVRRLRRTRGSVGQLAGAAGHEARAVRQATANVATEARGARVAEPTRLGDHAVKVTPRGRLVRCTSCGFLREEYAYELARDPELARRMLDVEEAAARAVREGDTAAARLAAKEASAVADALEAVRRTREVRAYRGLRPGAIDDLYLMDQRLVVDMPFVGRGARGATAQGWLRSQQHYWEEIVRRHPEAFSADNLRRIRGDPPLARPLAPLNDPTFRRVFPQYDVRGLRSRPLVHHHVAGGGQAAAVPEPLHRGFGGVHTVEREAGVWGVEDPIAEVLQRLLERAGAP